MKKAIFIFLFICLILSVFFKINLQNDIPYKYSQIKANKTVEKFKKESVQTYYFLYKNVEYEKEAKNLEDIPVIKVFHPGRETECQTVTLGKFADFFESSIFNEMIEANEVVTQKEVEQRKAIIKEESWAVEFDLNNDKENEIIGYRWDMCGTIECPLYILQKQADGRYFNISDSNTIPYVYQLNILQSSKNGFHDIGLISGGPGNGSQAAIRFNKNS